MVDPVAIIVGVSWTLTGLLCLGLAIPLILGKVHRNALYGVRFPQSLQSDEAWFAINRFGGKRFALWSLPLIAIGIVSLFLPLQSHTVLTVSAGFAPLIFILIPALESWRFARQYSSA